MKPVLPTALLLTAHIAQAAPALEGAFAEATVLVPMIETHRICQTQSAKMLDEGKQAFRADVMAKYKISEQEFDKYYADGVQKFKQQWSAMSKSERRKICTQWKQ